LSDNSIATNGENRLKGLFMSL